MILKKSTTRKGGDLNWKELHDRFLDYVKERNKYRDKKDQMQRHHLTPKREGGTQKVVCTNHEHNLFHYMLYKITGDNTNLIDIQSYRSDNTFHEDEIVDLFDYNIKDTYESE